MTSIIRELDDLDAGAAHGGAVPSAAPQEAAPGEPIGEVALSPAASGVYELDPVHSNVGFVARHAMVTKVRGRFTELSGSGFFDAADPSASELALTIEAASIDTGNEERDAHLRSNDFFAMGTYPEITFVATSVEPQDGEVFTVTGDLMMRGVSRAVSFDLSLSGPVRDPFGNLRIGLEGSLQVSRKDWGITWNAPLEAGGVLVGDKVTLTFDVSAIRVDEDAAAA